jgi:hypothetical protein
VAQPGDNTVSPNGLPLAILVFALMAGPAQAKVPCEEFKAKVNKVLRDEGRILLKWDASPSSKGFNSSNSSAGIKVSIECNGAGVLVEIGASALLLDDTDKTAEPIFVRGMLLAIDPKMTGDKADDLAQKARARLSLRKPPASHSFRVAEYNVVFEKVSNGSGGVRFRYQIGSRR